MDRLPNRELLEATHTFPGTYTFKAIGAADDHFIGRVVAAVRRELGEEIEPSFSTRSTSGGRHVCVTIEPPVEDAEVVLTIYASLREVEGLVLLLCNDKGGQLVTDVPDSAVMRRSSLIVLVAVLVLAAMLGFWLVDAVRNAREAARRTQCKGQYCGILLAMYNYHDVYGSFPPGVCLRP